MQREFGGMLFKLVCEIAPERDEQGQVKAYLPQNQYAKHKTTPLNAYGAGPFCRFRIPKAMLLMGVYIITVDRIPFYVGECKNFSKRYNIGYGQISPRNCFVGGQDTNCRLNNLIYQCAIDDKKIDLWFLETPDYKKVEAQLITVLGTRAYWNRKG